MSASKPVQVPPNLASGFGSEAILESLDAFSEVAASLGGVSEVQEICDRVVATLKARLGLRSCSIMLLSADGEALENVSGTSPRQGDAPRPKVHRRFRVGEGIAGTVAKTGEPILLSDADRDTRFSGGDAQVRVRSLLCMPISAADTRIGVINLSHAEPGFFNDDHRAVFAVLATILGKLISEARLHQELARFSRDLECQVADRTREIRASHAYLEHILSQASDIILTVDWRGRITFVNDRVTELGYDPEALSGQPFSVLFRDRVLPGELMDAMAGRVNRNVPLKLVGPDEQLLDTYCSFSPMEDDTIGGQGALVLVRDITAVRHLENQVRQMDKLTAIGTLVSGIAHEINNKLVPILVYSELLQRSELSENDLRLIQTVHKSATGARRIMESLLRFSRQEAPRQQVASLNRVVDDVIGMVRFRGKNQEVSLEVICNDALPDVYMDDHQIGQVALNLINNSYDALEACGGHIRVCTESAAGDMVRLVVEDDGPGIPEAVQSRIFDPFFTTKEVGKGTGLGLSLCFGIVQEHQGTITVDSSASGTRFEVTLPLSIPPASANRAAEDASAIAPPTSGRLLVAGNDPVLLEVLEHVLGAHHTVTRAVGGEQVIAHVRDHPVDLLVLDMNVSDTGGEEVLSWLEANRPELAACVLWLFGGLQEDGGQPADRVPPERVITKPFKVAEVRRAVDCLLGGMAGPSSGR